MAENIALKVTTRDIVGKANRRLDHTSLSGVVYGMAVESKAVSVDRHAF